MWWQSHQPALRLHPGQAQPRSRRVIARRIAAGKDRDAAPTSSTCDGAVQHGGDDPGVAGQHPGLAGADRAAVFQGGRTHPVAEVLQVDGDGDVRAFPALHGCVTEVQVPAQHLLQGLPAADGGGPGVGGAVRGGPGRGETVDGLARAVPPRGRRVSP